MERIIDSIVASKIRGAITVESVKKALSIYHIGDIVMIPGSLTFNGKEMKAEIVGIYKHHMVFRYIKTNITRSLINFDCLMIKKIQSNLPLKYEVVK